MARSRRWRRAPPSTGSRAADRQRADRADEGPGVTDGGCSDARAAPSLAIGRRCATPSGRGGSATHPARSLLAQRELAGLQTRPGVPLGVGKRADRQRLAQAAAERRCRVLHVVGRHPQRQVPHRDEQTRRPGRSRSSGCRIRAHRHPRRRAAGPWRRGGAPRRRGRTQRRCAAPAVTRPSTPPPAETSRAVGITAGIGPLQRGRHGGVDGLVPRGTLEPEVEPLADRQTTRGASGCQHVLQPGSRLGQPTGRERGCPARVSSALERGPSATSRLGVPRTPQELQAERSLARPAEPSPARPSGAPWPAVTCCPARLAGSLTSAWDVAAGTICPQGHPVALARQPREGSRPRARRPRWRRPGHGTPVPTTGAAGAGLAVPTTGSRATWRTRTGQGGALAWPWPVSVAAAPTVRLRPAGIGVGSGPVTGTTASTSWWWLPAPSTPPGAGRASTMPSPRPERAANGGRTTRGRVSAPPSTTATSTSPSWTRQSTSTCPSSSGRAWRTELPSSSESTTSTSAQTDSGRPAAARSSATRCRAAPTDDSLNGRAADRVSGRLHARCGAVTGTPVVGKSPSAVVPDHQPQAKPGRVDPVVCRRSRSTDPAEHLGRSVGDDRVHLQLEAQIDVVRLVDGPHGPTRPPSRCTLSTYRGKARTVSMPGPAIPTWMGNEPSRSRSGTRSIR